MKHLNKWFITAFAGIAIFSSCVDEIKFGDSFLEKAPSSGELNQILFLEKLNMPVRSFGRLIINFILVYLIIGIPE